MKSPFIRYGILSTASIVPRFVKGMRLTEHGMVCALASRSEEKARQMSEQLEIPQYYGDYRKILEDPAIDAVYIPTVNSLHAKYAEEALLAGKHVLVEKPFALKAGDARRLAALAREKNCFLTETVKTPHLPVYARIREIIDSGRYGKICYMDFRQSYVDGPYITGWNREREFGGGVLFGNEAYFFTMAEYLAGKAVSCTGTLSFTDHDAEDQCTVSASLPGGVIAVLHVSNRILFHNGLTIYLEKGRIEIPDYWKADRAYIYQGDELKETPEYPCESEFVYELNHYNQCITEGLVFSPVTPVSDAADHISFCEEIISHDRK